MSRRFRIQAGSTSPFRVSMTGVDALGAAFDQVLFDANQAPLRVWGQGYWLATIIENAWSNNITGSEAIARPVTPEGTYPLFLVMFRCQRLSGDPEGPHTDGVLTHSTPGVQNLGLAGQRGGGGLMRTTDFRALSWCRRSSGLGSYPVYINYLMMRNYL